MKATKIDKASLMMRKAVNALREASSGRWDRRAMELGKMVVEITGA
jgi:hypothetical protein